MKCWSVHRTEAIDPIERQREREICQEERERERDALTLIVLPFPFFIPCTDLKVALLTSTCDNGRFLCSQPLKCSDHSISTRDKDQDKQKAKTTPVLRSER